MSRTNGEKTTQTERENGEWEGWRRNAQMKSKFLLIIIIILKLFHGLFTPDENKDQGITIQNVGGGIDWNDWAKHLSLWSLGHVWTANQKQADYIHWQLSLGVEWAGPK